MGNKVVAIIPARGGSKTIKGKNIKLLSGFPLIAYSIAAGLQAKTIDRVVVSTDSEEIAKIASKFGAEIPFMRPVELAQDETPDLPVFKHALEWFGKNENYVPDLVVHLRPTSPFRPPEFVDLAVGKLGDNAKADSIRTIVHSGQDPYKMWRIGKGGFMEPILKVAGMREAYNMPRQRLPVTYWQTGHLDVVRSSTITKNNSMSGENIMPVEVDSRYAIDIDTEADWNLAEWWIKNVNLPLVLPK